MIVACAKSVARYSYSAQSSFRLQRLFGTKSYVLQQLLPPPKRTDEHRISTTTKTMPTDSSSLATRTVHDFCDVLSSKQPTPGGGASAAIGAAIGAGTASMSAAYTQRKKDEESGAADAARAMVAKMAIPSLLSMADDDVEAYLSLQSTWKKDSGLTVEEVKEIETNALRVPTVLVEACHERILAVAEFLPKCNPNITSDAKVGIHQLAGAARSAYQTVLVNSPPDEEKARLVKLLQEIQEIENGLLGF